MPEIPSVNIPIINIFSYALFVSTTFFLILVFGKYVMDVGVASTLINLSGFSSLVSAVFWQINGHLRHYCKLNPQRVVERYIFATEGPSELTTRYNNYLKDNNKFNKIQVGLMIVFLIAQAVLYASFILY